MLSFDPIKHLPVLVLAFFMVAPGCITPKEKRDLQNDVFNVQTRLLNLERQLTDTSKEAKSTGDSATRRLASTQADMDKVNRDLQQIKGEIDTLKVGVATGEMPGSAGTEPSVGATLRNLSERVEALEQAQEELINALAKAGVRKAPSKSSARAIKSVADLQKAYDSKRYKQVIEEAGNVLKNAGRGEKDQVRFLWAEGYYKLGKMREAALKFNDLMDSQPDPKFVPVTKMRIGDCFRNLGDGTTARVYYEELIKDYPESDEAAKAKERLAELDKSKETEKG